HSLERLADSPAAAIDGDIAGPVVAFLAALLHRCELVVGDVDVGDDLPAVVVRQAADGTDDAIEGAVDVVSERVGVVLDADEGAGLALGEADADALHANTPASTTPSTTQTHVTTRRARSSRSSACLAARSTLAQIRSSTMRASQTTVLTSDNSA